MRDFGVEMDAYTFSCVLKWFAATGNIEESERVHGYLLKLGFGSYNTCGGVESACKLFEELDDKDVISWNSMISGYAANVVDIDLVTVVSVMVVCANVGTLFLRRALHGYSIKASLSERSGTIPVFEKGRKSFVSWTSMIARYAREGL
ncbi:Pentatricopeptide repeat [Dillenia turbinata]|uniref:Pentatricopeptide repeat n=1 Tax=Dillenia turbinata TaxID=194707 RepID=A0AAN8VN98_9MAGN